MIIKDKIMAGADIRYRCAAINSAFALSGRAVCITIT